MSFSREFDKIKQLTVKSVRVTDEKIIVKFEKTRASMVIKAERDCLCDNSTFINTDMLTYMVGKNLCNIVSKPPVVVYRSDDGYNDHVKIAEHKLIDIDGIEYHFNLKNLSNGYYSGHISLHFYPNRRKKCNDEN